MGVSRGDTVVIDYTGRRADGSVFDTTVAEVAHESGLAYDYPERSYRPETFEVGTDKIPPGVEEALIGMEEGEEKTVTLAPEEAYGEHSPERVAEYDRGPFEEMLGETELAEGVVVEASETGLPGEVVAFDDETVSVDFNHELAGETVEFDIRVVELK